MCRGKTTEQSGRFPVPAFSRRRLFRTGGLVFVLNLLFIILPPAVRSQSPSGSRVIAQFQDWSVVRFFDGDTVSCSAFTERQTEAGAAALPVSSTVFVSHWPRREEYGQFSIQAGFDFSDEEQARITVGNQDLFILLTSQNRAWAQPRDQERLIRALWRHDGFSLLAVSENGRVYRELYSLQGFRQALVKIGEVCGREKDTDALERALPP